MLVAVTSPALAAKPVGRDMAALTYVQARAASLSGDHARSAQLLAGLAAGPDSSASIQRRAVSEAINAGDMALALRLAEKLPASELTAEARLLFVAHELKSKRSDRAIAYLQGEAEETNLAFLAPMVEVWKHAERRDRAALELLARIPRGNPLSSYVVENQAYVLLKLGRPEEAEPFAIRAIATSGAREHRLRLGLADAFLAAGDKERALKMTEGLGTEIAAAQRRIAAGKTSGMAIDSAAKAYAELLIGLAGDLSRLGNRSLPITLAQVARYAAPENSSSTILLAVLLNEREQPDAALAQLRLIPMGDALAPQARDFEARILTDQKRYEQALQLAWAAAHRPDATVGDFARLGDVLSEMERYAESADAYSRAIALTRTQKVEQLWPLYLLQASALESGNRWTEAKRALEQALALAPNQPLILNFLGYGKLERGEDLEAAEAMIVNAVTLAPEDASIIDSLGWAQFKRGRIGDAIKTLQEAAAKDPTQAEIREHLGDALYTGGFRREARFAWEAALVTAEDDIAARVKAKLTSGLMPANAAP